MVSGVAGEAIVEEVVRGVTAVLEQGNLFFEEGEE